MNSKFLKMTCAGCDKVHMIELDRDTDQFILWVAADELEDTDGKLKYPAAKGRAKSTVATLRTKSPKQRNCGKCGLPGHRADGCTKGTVLPQATPLSDPMSEQEFDDAKDLQSQDYTSFSAAAKCHVPLREVNIAYGSSDYQHYLKSRKDV